METIRRDLAGYLVALAGTLLVIAVFKLIFVGVNATTIALSFLLVVQVSASLRGIGPGIVAAIIGMFCFNYFFLPPVGTLTVSDPQNWVALAAFLITAVIASQLSAAAHLRAEDAEKRRAEVWNLYQLSRVIIATPDFDTAISSIARQVIEIFPADYCAIFIPGEAGQSLVPLATAQTESLTITFTPEAALLKKVFREGESLNLSNSSDLKVDPKTVNYMPLKVGIRPSGVMIIISAKLDYGAIEAITGLVALALERARFLQTVGLTEAIKQSDKLKSALLASVSHNLRTPLTAIRTSIDSLLKADCQWDEHALKEFHLIISEETFRLTRIVENLLEMARIEAGELKLLKEWCSISEIFQNVLDRCAAVLREHNVIIELAEDLPACKVDSQLIAEALVNLLENAAKYSPSHTTIRLNGNISDHQLIISVADEGMGIAKDEIDQIFDKFYRGDSSTRNCIPGTGMGLAIARGIIEAHGGNVRVESELQHGAKFIFSVPVETKQIAELISVDGEFYE